ncbi:MAG: cupin domain-containing protein [Brasilonema octagenarum HA4186-MV1]|jgi:oxalate decarboxylase|uniref:Cupin domain-containing protein n=2 Tax=Brasilonema TaxID=383614 RepID=A0A856MCN2_9CYAN|nr:MULTISPECIES: cupin domain-containing protein [Brasilonema]MBW4625937.1 cupin domain-containing protein [Brasilonema octagenarum HA4186-MV1]NMF64273.1 cupin domain-containing protein [Brasilonema octagenarum UFV-OR1]QDL06787.1 cupin domain-containing protein [Brasilonema sennae CENA114]QDL13156.1 cupin domain-containing protein [Brasilonema octagenarum UFV-E1]
MTIANTNSKVVNGVDPSCPYLFHLAALTPTTFDGGNLRGGNEDNWPALAGQKGATYFFHLEPGGVREPHWHPSAWEFNYVVSGKAKWAMQGLQQEHYTFEAGQGDVVFAPQGFFHYFENASDDEELIVMIVFNSSVPEPRNDLGIVNSLSVIPNDVMAAVFGVSADVFSNLPKIEKPVTIVKKRSSPA